MKHTTKIHIILPIFMLLLGMYGDDKLGKNKAVMKVHELVDAIALFKRD